MSRWWTKQTLLFPGCALCYLVTCEGECRFDEMGPECPGCGIPDPKHLHMDIDGLCAICRQNVRLGVPLACKTAAAREAQEVCRSDLPTNRRLRA